MDERSSEGLFKKLAGISGFWNYFPIGNSMELVHKPWTAVQGHELHEWPWRQHDTHHTSAMEVTRVATFRNDDQRVRTRSYLALVPSSTR
jgi:hypothetical protein